MGKQWQTLLLGAPKSLQMITAAMKLKDTPWKKSNDKPRKHIKSRDITLLTKVGIVKAIVFPIVMYGCESWTIIKAEHQRIDAFEPWCWRRLLRVPWTARRANQSILKEIVLNIHCKVWCCRWSSKIWPLNMKNWLLWKDPDLGKDWRQEEKGMTEDEMVGFHHWLNGQEFELGLGVGDGQGSLACCSPWVHKELDTTERLNWTELNCKDLMEAEEIKNRCKEYKE